MPNPPSTELLAAQPASTDPFRAPMLAGLGCMTLGLIGFTLLCAGLNVVGAVAFDPVVATLSALTAAGFGLPYLAVILWLDRNEQEPWYMVVAALAWGAIVATSLSMIANMSFEAVALLAFPEAVASQLTASISAPIAEESTKAAGLVLIYLFMRHDFDNVLDGVVYGALIGLGFAVFENFVYYVNTGDVAGVVALTLVRGVVTAIGSHPCFTAICGASIGLFRVLRAGRLRWAVPPAGLLLAIGVHFGWNTLTQLFLSGDGVLDLLFFLPMAVVVLQLPFVVLVLVVATLALRHERQIIETYLASELPPVVRDGELGWLVPARRRSLYLLGLLLTGKLGELLEGRRRAKLLIQLAFEKWHMAREVELGGAEAQVHAVRVVALREALGG